MPFTVAVRFYPGIGKAGEMRQLALERAKALQATGTDIQLSQATWGPEYPYFLQASRFATIGDYEAAQASRARVLPRFTAAFAPLSRQDPSTALAEVLQVTNPGPPPKWVVANTLAPALGKAAELRALLLEDGKRAESMGRRTALLVQLYGPESGVFTRQFIYESLADLDAARAALAADPGAADFVRKRDALLSRPVTSTVREVLIPFPTR